MKIKNLLILLCFSSLITKAQKGINSINIGPEMILITPKQNTLIGVGGTITGVFGVSNLTSITGSISFLPFKTKTSYVYHYSFIPVKVGLRSVFKNQKIYIHGQSGVAFSSGDFAHKANFIISGGLGGIIMAGKGYIDIAPSYDFVANLSGGYTWLGLKIAYGFVLPKKK